MRILIIESDKRGREKLGNLLSPQGHEVLECPDGESALALLEKEFIDIVLLDAATSDIPCLELARKIKAKKNIAVVLMTAIKMKGGCAPGIAGVVDEFLTKPFLREELLLRIRNVFAAKYHSSVLDTLVEKRTKKLKNALHRISELSRDSLLRLLVATEYRDDCTGNHVVRVGKISYLIARRLGMRHHFLNIIENAAQMHDLGKIGIPDSILLKRGRLTSEEFEVMKKHTTIGAGILQNGAIHLIRTACDIALMHHEKWNGCGYPFSKRGEEIPITARITALSDVFDSLMLERPYRIPIPWEMAVSIVKEESGKHFDPRIVDAFFKELDEVKALYAKRAHSVGRIEDLFRS